MPDKYEVPYFIFPFKNEILVHLFFNYVKFKIIIFSGLKDHFNYIYIFLCRQYTGIIDEWLLTKFSSYSDKGTYKL